MRIEHPALQVVLQQPESAWQLDNARSQPDVGNCTSLSLARALAVGCLSRLDQDQDSVSIWDPAAGSGQAGFLLASALESVGVQTHYRGQDIDASAVVTCRRRFEGAANADVAQGNTLTGDAFDGFEADLVIVDPPWGAAWHEWETEVAARRGAGAFPFGVPNRTDSTWLFISLALEKLRPMAMGGGRVAALVHKGALSSGGGASVRESIVGAGLLESVTRLPAGLAPNTQIPLFLMTFTNNSGAGLGKVKVADLHTQFTTDGRHRYIPVTSLRELETGLRTGKRGPRNRTISIRQLARHDAQLSRLTDAGDRLVWGISTYSDTPIDDNFLAARYSQKARVSVEREPRMEWDLDPSYVFGDDSRELVKGMESHGWPSRRLSEFLAHAPQAVKSPEDGAPEGQLFIPATRDGKVSTEPLDAGAAGKLLSIQLEGDRILPKFLAAWLNSEQGVASMEQASIRASSPNRPSVPGGFSPQGRMRWADELLIPVPDLSSQLALASADEQLVSYQADLSSQRASIWQAPERAEEVVNSLAHAFDDSLSAWLDQLPYPIASALWTAETTESPEAQQRAYLHAWEAMVTFHATVLLSATRNNPGSSSEAEAGIRKTLEAQHLGIQRASFATWKVIVEKASKDIRSVLETEDDDGVARVRRAFSDLSRTGIERLVSKDLVSKFNQVNVKRNRWRAHTGFTSEEELRSQVGSLVADLREVREILGNVWTQLVLVRAGSAKRGRDGFEQSAEVALGTRSPFVTKTFGVGEIMMDGELYLVRDGSQSPLRLGHFVQLRSAPANAQYTSYFYNRTEGTSVRMVSYQYGPDGEVSDDAESFREEFGGLA